MPEFLLVAAVAALFCLTRHETIRFCLSHFRRTLFQTRKPSRRNDPYRSNPEVERDRYRELNEQLLIELRKAREELQGTRMERDLALQDRDLRVLQGRAKFASTFALGALACFTSFNVLPQIAWDTGSYAAPARTERRERVAHDEFMHALMTMSAGYKLRYGCGTIMCCHRPRPRLVAFGDLIFRIDRLAPVAPSIEFFWRIPAPEDALMTTSGGETPRPMPQEPEPIRVEHAEPCQNETECAISYVLTAILD